VVGAFRNRAYAERKLVKCNEAGYTATIISFRNGLLAVSVCPSDDLNEVVKTLRQLRGTGICPKDGWILVNE
jgi:methyl coenzyme M reductase subunit C